MTTFLAYLIIGAVTAPAVAFLTYATISLTVSAIAMRGNPYRDTSTGAI